MIDGVMINQRESRSLVVLKREILVEKFKCHTGARVGLVGFRALLPSPVSRLPSF